MFSRSMNEGYAQVAQKHYLTCWQVSWEELGHTEGTNAVRSENLKKIIKKLSKNSSLNAQNRFLAIFPSNRGVRLRVNKSSGIRMRAHAWINFWTQNLFLADAGKNLQSKESLKKFCMCIVNYLKNKRSGAFLEVVQKMNHKFTKRTSLEIMVIQVVEFLSRGYKIWKLFA